MEPPPSLRRGGRGRLRRNLAPFRREGWGLAHPREGAEAGRGRIRWHVEGTGFPRLQRCAGGAGDAATLGPGQGAAEKTNSGVLGQTPQGRGSPCPRLQATQTGLERGRSQRSHSHRLCFSFLSSGSLRVGAPGTAGLGERGGGGGGRGREGVRPGRRELLVRGSRSWEEGGVGEQRSLLPGTA